MKTGDASHLYDPPSIGLGTYRVLDSVERDMDSKPLKRTKQRVHHALKHFPELDSTTVTVGKKPKEHTWYAEADWINDIIFLPTYEECPYITICHELGHLAIKKLDEKNVDVPITSEPFCSIFSVARMPTDRIDSGEIAYLGEPSKSRDRWPKICRHALDYREEHRDYIKQCKAWLGVET